MAFDLSQYETVEERLEKWWKENEDGSIQTELVNRPNANPDEFVFVARLYRTTADAVPVATGWASEIRTGSSFNKFACELAESSAIGRALANYIYSKKGARPSRTEMERVTNYSPAGSRARTVENVLRASFAEDKKEPTVWSVGDPLTLVPQTPPKPQVCANGEMLLKQGVAKTGKSYYGYVCNCGKPKDQQCAAKWAKMTSNGNWYFPDDAEDGKGGE
jgi:hypothetical protein